jgi:hypothetical protein
VGGSVAPFVEATLQLLHKTATPSIGNTKMINRVSFGKEQKYVFL